MAPYMQICQTMYGCAEVSVVIFIYGNPGDDSQLQIWRSMYCTNLVILQVLIALQQPGYHETVTIWPHIEIPNMGLILMTLMISIYRHNKDDIIRASSGNDHI